MALCICIGHAGSIGRLILKRFVVVDAIMGVLGDMVGVIPAVVTSRDVTGRL